MSRLLLAFFGSLAACGTAGRQDADPGAPAPERFPYPGPFWMEDGRVALGERLPSALTPVPGERVAWRTGFSPAQTAVIPLDAPLDLATVGDQRGVGVDGTVQLWDLTTGLQVPCFAEVDAFPEGSDPTPLIVRPAIPLALGSTIAVVVTRGVKWLDGSDYTPPDWYADALAGNPGRGVEAYAADLVATRDRLTALGVDDVALAFAFPVADGTAPMRSIYEAVTTPETWDLSTVEEADDPGSDLPEHVWKRIVGTIRTDNWLVDDTKFELDGDGLPTAQGQTDALLYVHFPTRVRDAGPGTVPVWLFGHGIFASPELYLADALDADAVIELADRAGAIVIATVWRGLTTADALGAARVGADFGRIPELTDKLAQGQANNFAISKAILEGGLLDDPAFGGLPKKGELLYYGISLGSIEGAVLLANQPEIEHAVFHVGGGGWSTMLERSSNWTTFETLVVGSGLDTRADRQLLYSASQLFWDPVDPVGYVDDLKGRSLLWQESIGDDQVPNLTTELLARGVGARLLTPAVDEPFGLDAIEAPTVGPAVSQFDPGIAPPPANNRPAPDTAAHETPRAWEGAKAQTLRFLDPADPGVVETFCGSAPCTADNTGD